MMYEVKMPRLGTTMKNGTVTTWLVDEGDEVEKGDPLFELQTEKSTVEMEAQASGVLRKIIVPEDEEVSINTVIAIIGERDEEIDLSKYESNEVSNESSYPPKEKIEISNPTEKIQATHRVRIVPGARKLAKELGIPIEELTGTGKNGLITMKDVQRANAQNNSVYIKEERTLNHVEKSMVKNILSSWQNVAQFTQMITVNMENVVNVKSELDKITYNDIFVKVIASVIKRYPKLNSQFDGKEKITIFDEINMSIAINSPSGLVVPVLKNVDKKTVSEISRETKVLVEKANNNELSPEDYMGGTITLSNLGSYGVEAGTPIINSPQSTIIFAGAIKKAPIVTEEDEIKIAPIMTLSICYDHRFIDGATAAEFTSALRDAFVNLKVEDLGYSPINS